MLDITLTTEFVPGTNLQGDLACADWRFLLPSIEFDSILCLGVPQVSSLAVLSTMSQKICIVSSDRCQLLELDKKIHHQNITNLYPFYIDSYAHLPFAGHSIALIFIPEPLSACKILQDPLALTEVARLLQPRGVMYFEIKQMIEHVVLHRLFRAFARKNFDIFQTFWFTPLTGEMRTGLPLWNRAISHYFFTHILYGHSVKKRMLSYAGRLLTRTGLLTYVTPRRALLVARSGAANHVHQPPQYLLSLAETAGIDLTAYRYGLSSRGKYNSNKVIFYLFGAEEPMPEVIIKITRAPRFNFRLENEYRMLSLLNKKSFLDDTTFPQPLFLGYHQNLAILGQLAIHGYPFRTRTLAKADCPVANDAIDWLVQLGTASAETSCVTPSEVEATVTKLFEKFSDIYQLSSTETLFLKEQIAFFGRSLTPFPVVCQHGDPGTWNIMVLPTGRVAFIDWEAGEQYGMPLWDLFYFLQTYNSWVSRRQGKRDRLRSFQQNILAPSALSGLLLEATECYCAGIGLERELVQPLFYTCWMHRALKEATRLPITSLADGVYVNLLRLCIAERSGSVLQSLLTRRSSVHNQPQGQ